MNRLSPNTIAHKLAGKLVLHNDHLLIQKDEIRYGLEWIILTLNQLILIFVLAIPLDILPEALVFYLASSILRTVSGGAHFKHYIGCLLYSTSVIIVSSLAVVHFLATWVSIMPYLIGLLCLSFLLVVWKAPVLYKNKHCFSPNQLTRKKWVSTFLFIILFLLSLSLFYNTSFMYAIWFALILQSLTLTNTMHHIFSVFK